MASRPRILQTIRLPFIQHELDRCYVVEKLWKHQDRDRFLADVGPGCAAVVTGAGTGASSSLLEALPGVGLVAVHGIGTDSVDLALARRRGIHVTTTPGVLTDDVADMAIGLILAIDRRIAANDRFVRAGSWANGSPDTGRRVSGRSVGIVGFGRIGRAFARRAAAFDMKVRYTDVRELETPFEFDSSLVRLAERSDYLVVTASSGPETRHLIGRHVIEAVGPEGVLVNVARGSLVDEIALIEALAEGRLGGAGLDVFETEPNVPDALLGFANVVLQPHQASATREARLAMGRLVLDNLKAYFRGELLPTPVVSA